MTTPTREELLKLCAQPIAIVKDRNFDGEVSIALHDGRHYIFSDGDCFERTGSMLGAYEAEFLTQHQFDERFAALLSAHQAQGEPATTQALDNLRDKWKMVDADCRDDGLITYHVDAFDEGARGVLEAFIEQQCGDVVWNEAVADHIEGLERQIDDYEEVLEDKRRLTRELDVLLNGEVGAAKQPSLCDIVAKVKATQGPFCPSCRGNDGDMPCAYPSKGAKGCLRDKRLASGAVYSTGDLIKAAEKHATNYEGDGRECIKADVINSFYAGAEFALSRAQVAQPVNDEQYSLGDTSEPCPDAGKDLWTSGIHIKKSSNFHGNAIECHALSKEKAEELRDKIFALLSAHQAQGEPEPVFWYDPASVQRRRMYEDVDQVVITGASSKWGNSTTPLYTNSPSSAQTDQVQGEQSAREYISMLPADWLKDSSLETWFPITAEEIASHKRMLVAACADLGVINEALGLDPDDGGAEPILDAIAEMKAASDQVWNEALEAAAIECGRQGIREINQASKAACKAAITAIRSLKRPLQAQEPVSDNCGNCQACRPITLDDMRMVLCEKCGNKRCPHANDHRNACTGSNEPGQTGSAYPASPAAQSGAVDDLPPLPFSSLMRINWIDSSKSQTLYPADQVREIQREAYELALSRAQAAQQAQPVSLPNGFVIKHVDGQGWVVTPPDGSKWVAYEGTPAGDFMRALLSQPAAPVIEQPAAVHFCPKDVGVCGKGGYCKECPHKPETEQPAAQKAGVPVAWRETVKQAAAALNIFTGHDSYANLNQQYGEKWWEAINQIETKLRAMLSAAPQPVAEQVGMPESQEPKYGIRDNRLFNRSSGEFIPTDEPVFIFRARDAHAVNVLAGYARDVSDLDHAEAVWRRVHDFKKFWLEHPDRMKQPDTAAHSQTAQAKGGEDANQD